MNPSKFLSSIQIFKVSIMSIGFSFKTILPIGYLPGFIFEQIPYIFNYIQYIKRYIPDFLHLSSMNFLMIYGSISYCRVIPTKQYTKQINGIEALKGYKPILYYFHD